MKKGLVIFILVVCVMQYSAFAKLYSPRTNQQTRSLLKRTTEQTQTATQTRTQTRTQTQTASSNMNENMRAVKSDAERRYDFNNDGYLDETEQKAMARRSGYYR